MAIRMIPRHTIRKTTEESQRVLDELDAYIESNTEEPMRWLVRFWKDQGAVLTYKELRSIITGETDPESLFADWFHDYSVFLQEKMTPVWEDAFQTGWKNSAALHGMADDVVGSDANIRRWITSRTGELITNCCEEQKAAVQYVMAEARSEFMSSAETARYIRPTIGLTERQAEANLKHYNAVKEKLRADHPRMKPENIEKKARESAAKYAEKQHRYRAETIARTELAFAYNNGNDEFIREAISNGSMPPVYKEWSTAMTNVCKACAALEGVQIGMDDEFKTKSGRKELTTMLPPLHPRCKCAVKYVEITGLRAIIKTDEQLGKKIGKHAWDYGLDPSKEEDRAKLSAIIDDIYNFPSEVRTGYWKGQNDIDVNFSIKGDDVVITNDEGYFVSILKGGVTNGRVANARRREI